MISIIKKAKSNKNLEESIVTTAMLGTLMSYYTNSAPNMSKKDADTILQKFTNTKR